MAVRACAGEVLSEALAEMAEEEARAALREERDRMLKDRCLGWQIKFIFGKCFDVLFRFRLASEAKEAAAEDLLEVRLAGRKSFPRFFYLKKYTLHNTVLKSFSFLVSHGGAKSKEVSVRSTMYCM